MCTTNNKVTLFLTEFIIHVKINMFSFRYQVCFNVSRLVWKRPKLFMRYSDFSDPVLQLSRNNNDLHKPFLHSSKRYVQMNNQSLFSKSDCPIYLFDDFEKTFNPWN